MGRNFLTALQVAHYATGLYLGLQVAHYATGHNSQNSHGWLVWMYHHRPAWGILAGEWAEAKADVIGLFGVVNAA